MELLARAGTFVHHLPASSNTNTIFLRNIHQFGVSDAGETVAKRRGSSPVMISQGKEVTQTNLCLFILVLEERQGKAQEGLMLCVSVSVWGRFMEK